MDQIGRVLGIKQSPFLGIRQESRRGQIGVPSPEELGATMAQQEAELKWLLSEVKKQKAQLKAVLEARQSEGGKS
jgi:hypothetical protein